MSSGLHPIFEQALAPWIPDSPTRVGAPDESGPQQPFSNLAERDRLDILRSLSSRSSYWREVLIEALAESDDNALGSLIDAALTPDADARRVIGMLRQILVDYADRVAAIRGDDLAELV